MKQRISLLIIFIFCHLALMAQAGLDVSGETDGGDGTDLPAFVPLVKVGKALYEGDSIQYVELNPLAVYPQLVFKNDKQRQAYNRLVANVKKVLPIAKEVNNIIIETYDFLQTLPNKKAKDEHLKRVERGIRAEYTPRMKKLTYRRANCSSNWSTASATRRRISWCRRSSVRYVRASTRRSRRSSVPRS